MKSSRVTIRVPATTANVGPGFDTLGLALQLYNDVEVAIKPLPEVTFTEQGSTAKGDRGAVKMVMQSARLFFKRAEIDEVGIDVKITTRVPIARGLGSSVTLRLGVIMGLNELLGQPLNKQEILEIVTELEGHPDNAAPAVFGGFVVSAQLASGVKYSRVKVDSSLKFVAAIPSFEVKTKSARELLPASIPFHDAVHNLNRTALLVSSFWDRDYTAIGELLEDRLHQPFRSDLIPQLFKTINAATLAGAIGGWLSGSGSTVMSLTLKNPVKVAEAMKNVFESSGVSCNVVQLRADNRGAFVLK